MAGILLLTAVCGGGSVSHPAAQRGLQRVLRHCLCLWTTRPPPRCPTVTQTIQRCSPCFAPTHPIYSAGPSLLPTTHARDAGSGDMVLF